MNPQLGWIEWCDTRALPRGWRQPGFDDGGWPSVAPTGESVPADACVEIGPLHRVLQPLRPMAAGVFAEVFGYERDDPPARFFLRQLDPGATPPQGVWRRYDLGRVRLGAPRFVLTAPAGAAVEFGYAESLIGGRVPPYIPLSAGPSCHLDHYVARGGRQTFGPLTPRGARFLEVHVHGPAAEIAFEEETFAERAYHGEPEGAFRCGDETLERIWLTGVETLRACAEDAVIDNPTRERGQWTGDTLTVGLHVAAAAYADLRLIRRCLIQSAALADGRGLVAGLSPGQPAWALTYAAQWVGACVDYLRLSGDRALLERLRPAAERNLAALATHAGRRGLEAAGGWVFIDWGCPPAAAGEFDAPLNLRYLEALRAMGAWCALLGDRDAGAAYEARAGRAAALLGEYFEETLAAGGWEAAGYHASALGLSNGFFTGARRREGVDFLKRHILRCYPNDPAAPRLSDPGVSTTRLITPYFFHFVFPLLIAEGETDFVLAQYRALWGGQLDQGLTTWLEVFDGRWSHCHHWSGCPTWQLSRFVLGLTPRFDLSADLYTLTLRPGSLRAASGALPLAGGAGQVEVSWRREGDEILYRVAAPRPVRLLGLGGGEAEAAVAVWDGTAFALVRRFSARAGAAGMTNGE